MVGFNVVQQKRDHEREPSSRPWPAMSTASQPTSQPTPDPADELVRTDDDTETHIYKTWPERPIPKAPILIYDGESCTKAWDHK